MQRQKKRAPPRKRSEVAQKDEDGFGVTALLEYLKAGAVSELTIVEVSSGTYRLEALLTWRARRSALRSARGGPREFRKLDTLVRFLKQIGVGKTVIRMELRQ